MCVDHYRGCYIPQMLLAVHVSKFHWNSNTTCVPSTVMHYVMHTQHVHTTCNVCGAWMLGLYEMQ